MAKCRTFENGGRTWIHFVCPATGETVVIPISEPPPITTRFRPLPAWSFDGNHDAPTLSPSVKQEWTFGDARERRCNHFFVRGGHVEYLGDCTHQHAGQTLPLADIDDEPDMSGVHHVG